MNLHGCIINDFLKSNLFLYCIELHRYCAAVITCIVRLSPTVSTLCASVSYTTEHHVQVYWTRAGGGKGVLLILEPTESLANEQHIQKTSNIPWEFLYPEKSIKMYFYPSFTNTTLMFFAHRSLSFSRIAFQLSCALAEFFYVEFAL